MGHGIAQISAMSGYNVTLRDVDQRFLDNAMNKIKWSLDKLVEKKGITPIEAEAILGRIKPVINLKESLLWADLLIEAIPEDLKLKKKVYSEVDSIANSNTIYASNTSTLPISELSALTNRPEKFVGLHFFNPPQLMKLVEVIPGSDTQDFVTKASLEFVKTLKKQPILCKKDVPGFIVNRIFIPLVHEAAYCMDRDGPTLVQIDSAVKFRLSFPMGIFELADYTGLDVIHKATTEMFARDPLVINPHPKIKELFDAGKLGKKSGAGFYSYGDDNYERINLSQEKSSQYDPIHLLSVALNNASWLISNKVCSIDELELALKLGMGLKNEIFETGRRFNFKKIVESLNGMESKYGAFYKPDPYLMTITEM
jgi:enoyl-CoA hydratase/3-hydroxyacyl-CoA dehydrogenase